MLQKPDRYSQEPQRKSSCEANLPALESRGRSYTATILFLSFPDWPADWPGSGREPDSRSQCTGSCPVLLRAAAVGGDPLTVAIAGGTEVSEWLTGLWQEAMQVKCMHKHIVQDADNNSILKVSGKQSPRWGVFAVYKARVAGRPCELALCKARTAGAALLELQD